jgi:hypothetical protein
MSWLNFDYGILVFDDVCSTKSPKIRLLDIKNEVQKISVNYDQSDRVALYTNENKQIAATTRPLAWDATTEIEFLRHIANEDNVRIKYTGTGTNPVFRTDRGMGGAADTQVTISRVTPYVARIQNIAGTVWTLGNIQVNDIIKFEKDTDAFPSPFSEINQGEAFVVQAKGSDFIDFVDNGNAILDSAITLGANYDKVLMVMSQGPVKLGDTIEISGAGINPSNHGKYTIVDMSPYYIEIINTLGHNETITIGTDTLVVYEHLIGFVHIRSSGPFKIRFDEQSEWATVDRVGQDALFIGSVSCHSVEAQNDGPEPIVISIQHMAVVGVDSAG